MAKGGRRTGSGRKRKPTALKVVQGTFRGDRHGNEPQVVTSWPSPPRFVKLNRRQAVIWKRLKNSDSWHALTDWPAVWLLVVSIDGLLQNHDAQRETPASGRPLVTLDTEENPLKTAELKILDRVYKFLVVNGYSPVDRARMPAVGEVTAENPLQKFIR